MRHLPMVLAVALVAGALPVAAPASDPSPKATAPAPEAAPSPAPASAEPAYVPAGEVQARLVASYDATRVRGPGVHMTLQSEGRWAGSIAGQSVRLQVTPGRITGSGVNLTVSRDAERITVEGAYVGTRVRITATRQSCEGRCGDRRLHATRREDGSWQQTLNTGSRVLPIGFRGSADRIPDVPMPQWIFAVMGAM
jgi:hypothetical protein